MGECYIHSRRIKGHCLQNGKLWATESVRTTGEPALLQVSAYKDKIKVADNELAFITVSIRDKTGSVVPTANHKIKCKLEGEGKIVATDNGDPTSLISFFSDRARNILTDSC